MRFKLVVVANTPFKSWKSRDRSMSDLCARISSCHIAKISFLTARGFFVLNEYQAGPAFTLFRCAPPPGVTTYDWDWAIPLMYRSLNAPGSGERFPARPKLSGGLEIDSRDFGYWNALSYLLTYSFGWTRHDRGLRWWYDAGKPTDDPRLALISEAWARDGALDHYLEWAHTDGRNAAYPISHIHQVKPDDLDRKWVEWLGKKVAERAIRQSNGEFDRPFGLHLEGGGHIESALGKPAWYDFRRHGERTQKAVLVLPDMDGWYGALTHVGQDLPELTESAWRIEVLVRSVGTLGEFRRSWDSGLWFSGPHRLHAVGQ